ncbi:MAG TPA: GGDEF domain-containing protein, partial [Deltaproteobacteria bacterium]|nr:GGDEF domain-containing protein [Deltaproteobacteria bacterium]
YHALTDDLSRIRHLEKIHEVFCSWVYSVLGASSNISVFRAGEKKSYYGWKTRNSKDLSGLFGKAGLLSVADTPLKFEQDHWLIEIIRKRQVIMSYEKMARDIHETMVSQADAELLSEAELVIPAFSKGRLLAFFVLGQKDNGMAYTSSEIDLLENFSLMISPYIENAMLLQGLEDEVEKRTSELNNALIESVTKEKQISERNKIITRQNQIFRTLLETSTTINQMEGLDDLFAFTLNQLRTLFSDFRGGIILEGKRNSILEASSFVGIEEQEQKVILDNRHEIMSPDIDKILRREMEKHGQASYIHDFRAVWNVFPMLSRGNKITGYMVIKGREMDKLTKEIFSVFLGQLSAVTQNKLLMGQLEKMASTDGLTGLYNRTFMNLELNKVVVHAKRFQSICFTVMMIDMNGLKSINDTYGHEKGDAAIICIASVLKKVCRSSDIVSRLGGDEFAVLMPSTSRPQAEILFQRIKEAAAGLNIECKDKHGQTHMMPVCISIGMASSDEFPPDEVMKMADTRMYDEKKRFYDENPEGLPVRNRTR